MLNKARKESKHHNINTIIISMNDSIQKHMNNNIQHTHKILTWQEGLRMTASINGDSTKELKDKISIYLISKKLKISTKFKNSIIHTSKEINGYLPDFFPQTTHIDTQNSIRREYTLNNNTSDNNIALFTLVNSIRALQIPQPQDMTNKILSLLTQSKNGETDNTLHDLQHTDHITDTDVLRAKKKLRGYIISELDKNTGQLYVACPLVEKQRLSENVEQCTNFELRKGLTTKYILDGIYTRYKELKLDKIEKWCTGTVPYMYPTPKHKDPINKTRIIASYFNFPLKRLYKLANKAGNWLLRHIPKRYRHFTLHSVGNVKNRLQEGMKRLRRQYKKKTEMFCFQTDVKQMFTFLCPTEIKNSIQWLFDIMKTTSKKRRPYNTMLAVSRAQDVKFPDNVRWGRGMNDENTVTMTFEDLMNIYTLDLDYSFTISQGQVNWQKLGCPIGGNLSSFFANVVCAYHEWKFITSLGKYAKNIYGIRQVDDLLVWIAIEQGNRKTLRRAKSIKKKFLKQNGVYKGGLELEEEKVRTTHERGTKFYHHEFAGVHITVRSRRPAMTCTTLNKNRESVRDTNEQIIVRYPPWHSYTTDQSKRGVIIGTLHRTHEQNSSTQLAAHSMFENYKEYLAIGYPSRFYKSVMTRMTRKLRDNQAMTNITRQTTALITEFEHIQKIDNHTDHT